MNDMQQAFTSSLDTIEYDNFGTAYVDQGAGEPIVMIHGVGLSHTMWFGQAPVLAEHFRVIRYDMLGHGNSPLPHAGVGIADYAEQLVNLLDHLEISSCTVVGFSLGALVAQKFAILHPWRLDRLVIMNSIYDRTPNQQLGVYGRALQVAVNGVGDTADAATERWFSESFRKRQPQLVDQIRDQLLDNDHMAYLRSYTIFATADQVLREKLRLVQCPTLVITGELDVGSTPEMTKEMSVIIPDATSVVVPGQRHMMPVENPEVTNRHLLEFLLEKEEL